MAGISRTVRFIADWVAQRPVRDHRRSGLDGRVISVVFKAAVRRRFSPTLDIREMSYFIIDYGLRHPDESDLVPVREGQALIRVVLGEPGLRRYIAKPLEEQAVLPLAVWILRDLGMSPTELVAFLVDIERRPGN
jgi:hypothetical protein